MRTQAAENPCSNLSGYGKLEHTFIQRQSRPASCYALLYWNDSHDALELPGLRRSSLGTTDSNLQRRFPCERDCVDQLTVTTLELLLYCYQ